MVIPVSKPKVSSSEKKYRQELFPDVREIKNKNLLCTSCGSSVKDLITKGKPIVHPFLETLLCEKCLSFYGDGQFSVDEDGSDKYCRWCGQGGTLFLCSKCTSGFCKRCVKRNLPKSAQAKIEDDDWVCYCCDTGPLYELRAQCWAAQQYAAEHVKNKGSSKVKKGSKESSKRSRNSDSSETEEPVPSKKKRKEELKGKNDKKRRNGDEKEDSGGRSLRKRESKSLKNDSGSESDDQTENSKKTLPSGVSVDRIHAALNKLTSFVADIAGMTKETHKKLLECKNKKINLKNINSSESVVDIHSKLSAMLVTLESNVRIVRKGLEEYVEEWCKMVEEDRKIKGENEGAEAKIKVDDSERLENGIPSDNNQTKEASAEPEPEDMEVSDKSGEEKHPQSDKESNDGDSVAEEKKSPKKQNDGKANGEEKEETISDQQAEERIPQVAEKKQEEPIGGGHGDSVIKEGKVSSEGGEQASSSAETTLSSNDSDPPGKAS